jgi:Immunity protein Imm1
MYVKKIWIENEADTSEEIIHPSWEQIISALNMMDGNNRSTIILYPDVDDEIEDPEFMSICGGENNSFTCSTYNKNGSESYLINTNEVSEETITFYTGQSSMKPKNQIVNLVMILKAIKTYVETGDLDTTLIWCDG